ncbi:E3 ubiquitin-protein ligase RLIM-like isoform X1 [Plodia interpunctella]|uniref:E3 ubiquitin-protein ligase RLIM-like isoform X1 n=1 Tax=Plodia interpunctella TaxID=58824 RepID=UPI002367A74E|nr:E3 ubiquitin-protein ligase RLIM-like isoform X1 [Plodia interpunctella]XP_053623265.1 E3 ubiquitin-protein ligase RLIM-like isoform X1 [Plodia interpunctella]
MNVREEERQKNACPNRGLGLAAAAIGVGVGAALYYFFSKRTENPNGEGSTSVWNTEQTHAFDTSLLEDSDAYTTLSEHSTTDTSMEETDNGDSYTNSSNSSNESLNLSETSFQTLSSHQSTDNILNSTIDLSSDTDITDWDVTSSSLDVPEDVRSPAIMFLNLFRNLSPARNVAQDRVTTIRDQAFRERSWSLEECSICFDVILKNQQVTTLPCTHHFHSDCIAPWLQEQQTCPNCRKSAE